LLLWQTLKKQNKLGEYHFNLAKNIDYIWASLLFGTDGHTVSAVCFNRSLYNTKYKKYVRIIDWLFGDYLHCQSAYDYEFVEKPNLILKVT